MKTKNIILFIMYSLCLGGIIGAIVWTFLKLMGICINLLWVKIPNMVNIPFYTIIVCTIGGVIIGIWKKLTGDYPEELEDIIKKVKKDGRYNYEKTGIMCVSAFLPLIFGGSVGPEAGLTGVIVGLCSWLSDKFKHLFKEMKELTSIGLTATIGTIFNAPMFGFTLPIESDDEIIIPKASKTVLYFTSIFGALGSAIILGNLFGGSEGIGNFENLNVGKNEWIGLIPLCLIGIAMGGLYLGFNKITTMISKKMEKFIILKSIIAGVLLGSVGLALPLIMFSGEEQLGEVIGNYEEIGMVILIVTAIVKMLITNICNSFGFKGGHFFPNIFAGVCMGFGCTLLTGLNPTFCACVVTTSLMSFLIGKPFAVIMLLMICFPVQAIPVMLVASASGTLMKKCIYSLKIYLSKQCKEDEIKCCNGGK